MNAARPASWPKLARFRGDTTRLPFRLTDERGAVYNPTGRTLICTVKADPTAADTAALIQKISAVGGIYVTDAAAGLIEVELVPADYDGLTVGSTYQVDVQGQDAGTGAVRTVGRATLTIADDVTKGTTLAIPTTTTNPAVGYAWGSIPHKPALIAAHAALTAAADRLAYITAADGAALTTFTAYARQLLAAANAGDFKTILALAKADVGLAAVDNTADADKPVSTAQAAADTAVGAAAAADATAKANAAIAIAAADATAKANAAQAASQPLDPTLTALAAIATAADKLIYATGADAFATCDLTATGRSLIASASVAAARTALGFGTAALGTLTYGSGADTLAVLAGNITVTKKFLAQTGTGAASAAPAWSTLVAGDIPDLSATYQPLSGALTALGQVATNGGLYRTAANTYAARTITGTAGQINVAYGDGVAGNPTISLPATITQAMTFPGMTVWGENSVISPQLFIENRYFPQGSGTEVRFRHSSDEGPSFLYDVGAIQMVQTSVAPQADMVFWTGSNRGGTFAQRMRISSTGVVSIASAAESTNTTSGALVVGANVGLSGYAGGASYFGGPVTVNGPVLSHGSLGVVDASPAPLLNARLNIGKAGSGANDYAMPSGIGLRVASDGYTTASSAGFVNLSGGYGDSGFVAAWTLKSARTAAGYAGSNVFKITSHTWATETDRFLLTENGGIFTGKLMAAADGFGSINLRDDFWGMSVRNVGGGELRHFTSNSAAALYSIGSTGAGESVNFTPFVTLSGLDSLGSGKFAILATATASNTTSGALVVGTNVGLSGALGGSSYFGGAVISSRNAAAENWTAQGVSVIGGSSTGTLHTFANVASDQVYLICVRQQGAASNNAVAIVFINAANATVTRIAQDNTNPALTLDFSFSGLSLQLTPGSGYGTTTWEYTVTPIAA